LKIKPSDRVTAISGVKAGILPVDGPRKMPSGPLTERQQLGITFADDEHSRSWRNDLFYRTTNSVHDPRVLV